MDSEKGENEKKVKQLMSSNTKLQSDIVLDRINEIEKTLKQKMQRNYVSVR